MKHIKKFENMSSPNLDKDLFNPDNYDNIVKEDLSEMVRFLLEDLPYYISEGRIDGSKLTKDSVQKMINELKSNYLPSSERFYSTKEKYESIISRLFN